MILLVGVGALLAGVLATAVCFCSWYRRKHMQHRMKQSFNMQQPPPGNTNAPTNPLTTTVEVEMT